MGKKGGLNRLKRMHAPVHWPVAHKRFQWAPKTVPGPHPIATSTPLTIALMEMLGYAESRREVKFPISEGRVKIDGRVVNDPRFPIGYMDVLEIPDAKACYRALPHPKKGLILHSIGDDEKTFKLCKIRGKKTLRQGRVQLSLHDGRTILLGEKAEKGAEEPPYKPDDVLVIKLPTGQIIGDVRFSDGAYALIVGGKNRGSLGRIRQISKVEGTARSMVIIETDEGKHLQSYRSNIFVVGQERPLISLPGVVLR